VEISGNKENVSSSCPGKYTLEMEKYAPKYPGKLHPPGVDLGVDLRAHQLLYWTIN